MRVAKLGLERGYALAVGLVAAYVGAVLFSVLATRMSGQATLWLATGFLASALILTPRSQHAAICMACAFGQAGVNLAVGDGVLKALLYPSVNVVEAAVAAWLAISFCGAKARRLSLRELTLLVVGAIVPAAMVGGAVGSLVNFAVRGEGLLDGWLDWAIPAALGMVIVTPTVLFMARIGRYPEFRRPLVEVLALLGLLCGLTAVVYVQHDLPVQFGIFPALTLIAVRLGPPGAAVATLLVTVISLPLVTLGPAQASLWPTLDAFARARLTEVVIAAALFSALATAVSVADQARLKSLVLRRDRVARAARARARAAEDAVRQRAADAADAPVQAVSEVIA